MPQNNRVDQSAHNDNLPHWAVSPATVPEPDELPSMPDQPEIPNHAPETDVPMHQSPGRVPEHDVQASDKREGALPQQQRKVPDPEIPERKNEPGRQAPPSEDQDMNKRMQSQRDDPAEGPVM